MAGSSGGSLFPGPHQLLEAPAGLGSATPSTLTSPPLPAWAACLPRIKTRDGTGPPGDPPRPKTLNLVNQKSPLAL